MICKSNNCFDNLNQNKMEKTQNMKEQITQKKLEVKSLNQDKQKYEYIWKSFYLVISIVSAILFKKVYLFQTLPEYDSVRKGTIIDLLMYAIPFCIAFTLFDLQVHRVFDKKCEENFITLERYKDPKSKSKRSYTLVKWCYSLIYYFISSISAYLIIKDTSYFPSWLGGSGQCSNLFVKGAVLDEATTSMKFGKHLSRMLSHMFIRQEGNYYEYILHHALSTFLILFSYLMNMWLIGIFVLLLHDFSDFFLISARCYKDYRHYSKRFLQVIYVLAMTSWIGCRIIVFSSCCVYPSVVDSFTVLDPVLDQLGKQVIWLPYLFMGLMLGALQILQLFWTYYIASSFISVNISEKVAKHTYD